MMESNAPTETGPRRLKISIKTNSNSRNDFLIEVFTEISFC